MKHNKSKTSPNGNGEGDFFMRRCTIANDTSATIKVGASMGAANDEAMCTNTKVTIAPGKEARNALDICNESMMVWRVMWQETESGFILDTGVFRYALQEEDFNEKYPFEIRIGRENGMATASFEHRSGQQQFMAFGF